MLGYAEGWNDAAASYEPRITKLERIIAILRADVERQEHVIEVLAANQKESS